MAKISKSLRNLLLCVEQDKKEKEMDVALRFISDLYYTIAEEDKKNKKKPSPSFKPSSMHCCRNMQYQINEVELDEDKVSPELVGILESGTDRHLRIQTAIMKMKDHGINCEYVKVGDYIRQKQAQGFLLDLEIVEEDGIETKIYNKAWNISFMADGILLYNNRYYILEIKTETTNKNQKRIAMDENHIPQICAYYLSFEIPDVIMLYENRDNCVKKAYYVKVTDEMLLDNVVSKIEEVNRCNKDAVLATAQTSKNCTYCPYKTRCRKDGGGY